MAKILVIDDDVTMLRFLKEYLEGDGFELLTANRGSEGLKLAYRDHPDLVVSDVMMPEMDGWEVTARLHEMTDVPIILLTAKSSEADKLRGFKLGVDDYVTKPFSFAELSARINAVLSRSRGGSEVEQKNQVTFGNFTLDMDRRELKNSGAVVTLTPTEYKLLETLATRRGRAVAEDELIKEVWGAYRQDETAAVRRYVFLLRQKIETDPSDPQFIMTVRGYGYRLETAAIGI